MTATIAFLAQIAQAQLPTVESNPERIAMLLVLHRTGDVTVHLDQRKGRTLAVLETLTPLGRKMGSCLDGGIAAPPDHGVLGLQGP
jgi:hypothetical protein